MRGETTIHREAVMLSEATWQAARAIRTPDWKLIRLPDHPPRALRRRAYDMRADPGAAQCGRPVPRGGGRPRRPAPPLGFGPAGRATRPDARGDRCRTSGSGPSERRHRWTGPSPPRRSEPARARALRCPHRLTSARADGVGLHAQWPPLPAVEPTATRERMTQRDPAEREAPASARLEEPLGSSST